MIKRFFIFIILTFNIQLALADKLPFVDKDYVLDHQIESYLKNSNFEFKTQWASQLYSIKGNVYKSIELDITSQSGRIRNSDLLKSRYLNNFKSVSAKKYILENAKKHEVIIFNESHHIPVHREFVSSLLNDLYALGYRKIGLEALENDKLIIESINRRGYPIKYDGLYTQNPTFANLIRNAKNIGFTLFAYEAKNLSDDQELKMTEAEKFQYREKEQAKNIYSYIDGSSKTIILCGHGHGAEGVKDSGTKFMAQYLSEAIGRDLFTVNQSEFSYTVHPDFTFDLKLNFNEDSPFVLLNENYEPQKIDKGGLSFDTYVFHALNMVSDDRQSWFLMKKTKFEFDLDLKIKPPYFLASIPIKEDYKQAVPEDLVEVKNSDGKVVLFINENTDYNIVVFSDTYERQVVGKISEMKFVEE